MAGFIAGYTILILERLFKKLPETFSGVKTQLYPLISVIVIGACSEAVVEPLAGAVNSAMNAGLNSMSGTTKVLLGLVVEGMEAVDMGARSTRRLICLL